MDGLTELITGLLFPTTVAGIALRGLIWSAIAIVIVISSNRYSAKVDTTAAIKQRVGSLLLFLVLSVGLVYLLFSYIPA